MRGWLLSAFLIAGCAFGQTKSALETDAKGWKDILPPESLKGWTRISIPPTQPLNPEQQWKVDSANRFLVCEGDKGHDWLRYDQELGDFIFHVEFRFTKLQDETGKRYNSGIFARNDEQGNIWHQAQIGSSSGGYFFGTTLVAGEKKRFNLLDKTKPSLVKAAGEWNTVEIRAQGKKMTLWVNGEVTSEFDNTDVTKGYIGLEAEGYRIEFRSLKLKNL
jgi:hypothetical protein